jgi:arylsulfatase A-like enzyme
MLFSHGGQKKQQPYDESIRVPFLIRYPARLKPRELDTPINTPDIMPTLLGLCGIGSPSSVEGDDLSRDLLHERTPDKESALLMCVVPFGQWTRSRGGKEYRGVRTARYTYVRDLNGPQRCSKHRRTWCLSRNCAEGPKGNLSYCFNGRYQIRA